MDEEMESGCRRSNRVRKTRRIQSPVTWTTTRQQKTKVTTTKSSSFVRQPKQGTSSNRRQPHSDVESVDYVTTDAVPQPQTSSEGNRMTREAYLDESKSFALNIARQCSDPDADRLYCPVFKRNGCGCIQKYVESDGRRESEERVFGLLHLIKEAKRLSRQKCYDTNEKRRTESGRQRNIGLGNGQKKSKAFEEFVLENRDRLRYQFHFCERATQKILVYSNNFLHKRLKTVPEKGSRVRRRKGRAILGLLPPIERLASERCCSSNCVALAVTHSRLVLDWRQRVTLGQVEARRVLAEMLTPSGGSKTNCYSFIAMVTGCSNSTISKVNEQMKRTGGDREPPEHGLKKWHKTNQCNEERTTVLENEKDAFSEMELDPVETRLESVYFGSNCRRFAYVRPNTSLLLNVPCLDEPTQLRPVPLVDRYTATQPKEISGPSFLVDVPSQLHFDRLPVGFSIERNTRTSNEDDETECSAVPPPPLDVDSRSLEMDSLSFSVLFKA